MAFVAWNQAEGTAEVHVLDDRPELRPGNRKVRTYERVTAPVIGTSIPTHHATYNLDVTAGSP